MWHADDIFSRLLKVYYARASRCKASTDSRQERIICLNGEVDQPTSASTVAQLLFLEAENPEKPINLYINSPGGSVTAGTCTFHPSHTHYAYLLTELM